MKNKNFYNMIQEQIDQINNECEDCPVLNDLDYAIDKSEILEKKVLELENEIKLATSIIIKLKDK